MTTVEIGCSPRSETGFVSCLGTRKAPGTPAFSTGTFPGKDRPDKAAQVGSILSTWTI
jgi:hypothetical protein